MESESMFDDISEKSLRSHRIKCFGMQAVLEEDIISIIKMKSKEQGKALVQDVAKGLIQLGWKKETKEKGE